MLANAWIEVATVSAILGDTALGAALQNAPLWIDSLDTATRQASMLLGSLFAIAALWARAIPATACSKSREARTVARFGQRSSTLYRDQQGQISLAMTALFLAVAAVPQFLVICWAKTVLHLSLSEAAMLQCCLAAGVVAGSLGVARFVAASAALQVLPADTALGLSIILVSQVNELWILCVALCATGILAGVVMVPINALPQQRGNALMPSGASIVVQSFSENLASLVFLAVYGMLLTLAVPVYAIIVGFGLLVTALMVLVGRRGSRLPPHAA